VNLWLRHLASVVALPFVVTLVVPVWLARRSHSILEVGSSPLSILAQVAGVLLLLLGLLLFLSSFRRFAAEGEGTLAPWDPPQRLVVSGPYRYVRHPMISGVVFIVFGEALVLQSRPQLNWALLFLAINLVYIPLLEEPLLARRFGPDYAAYRRHVPLLFPRLHPWDRGDQSADGSA
jgi:protein-S-isoprenylcysteine O-methyltransferase Ste14